MGATADLERVAPQWSKRYQDKYGTDKIRVAGCHVVDTVRGRDELQWLDVTIRRPAAVANVEGAARFGGFAAIQGEKEKTRKYGNRNEIGHSEADQVRVGREARTSRADDETG